MDYCHKHSNKLKFKRFCVRVMKGGRIQSQLLQMNYGLDNRVSIVNSFKEVNE